MPNAVISGKQIKGLVPAVDSRLIEQPFCIDGRNFLVDFNGPYAAFSSRIFHYTPFSNPGYEQSWRIAGDTDTLYLTFNAFLRFDWTSQRYYVVHTFIETADDWPWSLTTVNQIHYLCKKGLVDQFGNSAILRFDPALNQWDTIIANIPNGANSVSNARGRLAVLGTTRFSWSALDDGDNMSPDLTTGAGFQDVTAITGGHAIAPIQSVVDGVVIYTSEGAMKSEFSQTVNIFRHYPLAAVKPINPYCVCSLTHDKSHVILDISGLYVVNAGSVANIQYTGIPTKWEPLFSEFISHILLPTIDKSNLKEIRLVYFEDSQLFFIMIKSATNDNVADYAFCLYLNREEWGRFDRQHINIIEVFAASGPNKGFNLAYIDTHGYINIFVNFTFKELPPVDPLLYLFQTYHNNPVYIEDDVFRFGTVLALTEIDESIFSTSGMYSLPNITTPSIYLPPNSGLNSYIIVGNFRWTEQKYEDEMGEVGDVLLAVDNVTTATSREDWANFGSNISEDFTNEANNSSEDWGYNDLSDILYSASIIGTNDGTNVFVFDDGTTNEETLTLAYDEGKNKYYTCFNTAIYHQIRLNAINAGETFHLRLIELSGNVAGRL